MKLVFVLVACAIVLTHGEVELVQTPVGLLPAECVHDLDLSSSVSSDELGNTIITDINGGKRMVPRCPHDLSEYIQVEERLTPFESHSEGKREVDVSHGWQAYTAWDFTQAGGISSFIGNFSVPDLPPKPTREQILYIFTGLQNINWIPEPNSPPPTQAFDIIQPVLQYPGVRGDYWSIRSWYVTILSGAFASNEVKVPPGDTIFGNMTQTGEIEWFIESFSFSAQQSTNATVSHNRLKSQPWAYCTLEVYNVNSCDQYPDNAIQFTGMELFDAAGNSITPVWDAIEGQELACGEKADVLSPDAVNIDFQKSE